MTAWAHLHTSSLEQNYLDRGHTAYTEGPTTGENARSYRIESSQGTTAQLPPLLQSEEVKH